jgi:DnaJ-class molecular chaperone
MRWRDIRGESSAAVDTLAPYELLGVSRDPTEEEIRQAYRQLVRKFHPDLHAEERRPWAEERMQIVNQCYEALMGAHREETPRRIISWREAS